MSREAILKIKEAEAEADRIVAAAHERARQMISDAENDGRELCRAAEAETRAELDGMLQQIRERTAQLGERLHTENTEEAAQMKRNVALRRKIAEKIIIRGFEAKCR